MLASPKYVITYLIMRLILVLLVCPCVASSLTKNGYLAVGAIQRNVSMNWQINTTGISSNRFVLHPSGSTVIFFPANSVLGNVAAAFANRVRDVGNVSQSIVSFSLLSLTVADAGRYFYKIFPDTDAGGQDLVIAGYPANVSIKEVSPPYENKQYKLQCSAESTSVPLGMGLTMLYQWKRENGQNITVSDRYSFSSDQSNLIINSVKKEDNGTVVCEAWEHVEAVSQSAPFLVKVILEQGIASTTSIINTPANTDENDSHQRAIIISVSVGVLVVVIVIIIIICCCCKRKKDQAKHKAHHAIARNGSKSTNERNELHNVTNTSQVDSCLDVSKVPNIKSDKGKSNAQIQSSTRI